MLKGERGRRNKRDKMMNQIPHDVAKLTRHSPCTQFTDPSEYTRHKYTAEENLNR